MKLNKKQKKLIKKYSKKLSSSEIAKEISADIGDVEEYLEKFGNGKSKIRVTKNTGPVSFESFKELKKFWFKHLDFFTLIAVLLLLVYVNAFNGAFISDDIEGIVNNPAVNDMEIALQSLNINTIHHALMVSIFGMTPIPLHINSVILHLINVILVFTLIRMLFGKKESMFIAILFALHPVNVESITWISGSGYPIRAFFTMLILLIYAIFLESNNKNYFWIAWGIFLLQMILLPTPQNLILLPLLLVFEYFIKNQKFRIKNISRYIPYLFLYGVYFYEFQKNISTRILSTNPVDEIKTPYIQRLGYSIYKSISLLVAPVKLSLYHDAEIITPVILWTMYASLTILVIYIVKNLFKKRDRYFGWVLFALASVLYMLSPIQVAWFIAERYLYVATIAFAVIIVMFLSKVEREYKFKNLTLITVLLISIIYSTRVIARNMDWQSRKSLWESTAEVYPNSARAYNNLGDVYAKEENWDKSIENFEKAIELQPNYVDAIHNLGVTYFHMDEYDKATEQFKKALELNPNLYQSLFHLAATKFEEEKYDEALQYTEQLLQINPDYEPAIQGKILLQQKIMEQSLEQQSSNSIDTETTSTE